MKNMNELKSTLSELQVCTDASLVCASTTESLNVKAAKMGILSSDYIGEEKHDMDEAKADIAEIGKNKVRVPVIAADGTPLMPCTAAKAKRLLKAGKFGVLKKIKRRESNIIRNLNHEISKAVVETAVKENAGIKLEKLEGIRNNRKHSRSFNYSLNSWSFYQLQMFIEYKAELNGIPLTYIEPKYTSQECSRCGDMGIRDSKKFVCNCGHVDHADVNASFNIAQRPPIGEGISQLNIDRDMFKGSTDTPQGATV